MSTFARLSLVVATLAVFAAGCPGAQVKDGGAAPGDGKVDVVLRRVDVVKAGYDQMTLNVIIAVVNGTGDDVDVDAAVDLALVGPADDAGEDEGADEDEGEEAGAEEASGTAAGLDGARHAGRGGGTAKAFNTSELPVQVVLPLPSDPEVLEQVLSWKKAKVHIKGKAKTGFAEQTLAGERDMATPQLPELKLKSAQIAKVDNGAGGEAFFTLLLENTNPFEVSVDRVTWKIMVAGKELKSKDDGSTSVPPSSVEQYDQNVELNEAAFPAKELKALLQQPAVPYEVTGTIEVRGIHKDVDFKGEMQFPR